MSLTGVSSSSLRNYTRDYERYFSTEATTTPRHFTEEDLRLIAFIVDCTKGRALTHDQVAERLLAGDLDTFTWLAPEMPQTPTDAAGESYGLLVPAERVQAAQALLQDAQRRENDAIAEAKAAQERIAELERELGVAQGRLEGVERSQYTAPKWWKALFGGRAAE